MTRETFTLAASEVRISPDDNGAFSGYAAHFGAPNAFDEVIKPGAFRRSLQERGAGVVPLLWQHNPSAPIGVWTSIVEDARGLKVAGRLILETVQGREAHALMKAGAISGLSIGFRARQQERAANGQRVLVDIDLAEISLVTMPADRDARVTSVRTSASADFAAFTTAVRRTAEALKR
jgi:uncharacterized protein